MYLFTGFIKRLSSVLINLSLVKKLILAYIIAIAIPMFIFGLYSFNNISQNAKNESLKNSVHIVVQTRADIEKNVLICSRAAQIAIHYKNLVEFLAFQGDYSAKELIEFKNGPLKYFENIHNINPDIHKMRIFIKNEKINEIWPSIFHESRIINEKWYDMVIDKKGLNYWRLNHKEEHLQGRSEVWDLKEVVSLYCELQRPGNVHIGVIEVSMKADVFFKELYNTVYDNHSMMVAVGGDGRLIYNGNNQNAIEWIGRLDNEFINNLNKQDKNAEYFNFNDATGKFLVTGSYIKSIDSYICRITSTQALTQNLKKTSRRIALGIIGGFFALTIITYLIIKILLRKMNSVIQAMRKVQEGKLDVEMHVEGNDEIGELASHFQKMMRKINELISIVVRKRRLPLKRLS